MKNNARLTQFKNKSFLHFVLFFQFLLIFPSLHSYANFTHSIECPEQSCMSFCNYYYLELEAGYQNFYMLPAFSFGQITIIPGTLTPIECLTSKDETAESPYIRLLAGTTIDSSCLPCWIGECLDIQLSGHFFQDNKKNSCAIGPGVLTLNAIDKDESDVFFVINQRLTAGSFHRDYQYFGGDLELFGRHCFSSCQNPCLNSLAFRPYISFGIHEFNQDYKINLIGARTPGVDYFSLDQEQQLHTTYYDFGSGLEINYCLFPCLFYFIKGAVFGSFSHARLYSTQTFVRTGPFSGDLSEMHDTFNSKIKASTGFDYRSRAWSIGIVGNYEYWGNLPRVENAQLNGNNELVNGPLHIASSSTAFYSIAGRLGYIF